MNTTQLVLDHAHYTINKLIFVGHEHWCACIRAYDEHCLGELHVGVRARRPALLLRYVSGTC